MTTDEIPPIARLRLGPERVAQLADERLAQWPAKGTWGVWCLHERRWVDLDGGNSERDAWRALIQVTSRHPWELRVAQADEDGRPVLPKADGSHPCDTCGGTGDCPTCHTSDECPDCDGSGRVKEE